MLHLPTNSISISIGLPVVSHGKRCCRRLLSPFACAKSPASLSTENTLSGLSTTTTSVPLSCSSSASTGEPSVSVTLSSPPEPVERYPWLIVGIGNPGNKFERTRHNVGFDMIDAIADSEGIKMNTIQQKALTGKGMIGPSQVLLAKPQTYVNLTGESIGPLAAYYRIPVQQILLIYDDMDLEFGVMRLLPKGGAGGHNGVKSVIDNLKGCKLFPRLKIGIGRPPGTMDPAAFVLQKFDETERKEIDNLLVRGVDVIREIAHNGLERAISRCNQVRKSRMNLTPEEREILKQI